MEIPWFEMSFAFAIGAIFGGVVTFRVASTMSRDAVQHMAYLVEHAGDRKRRMQIARWMRRWRL